MFACTPRNASGPGAAHADAAQGAEKVRRMRAWEASALKRYRPLFDRVPALPKVRQLVERGAGPSRCASSGGWVPRAPKAPVNVSPLLARMGSAVRQELRS